MKEKEEEFEGEGRRGWRRWMRKMEEMNEEDGGHE